MIAARSHGPVGLRHLRNPLGAQGRAQYDQPQPKCKVGMLVLGTSITA
jgi:hypothetical protein